MDFTQYTLQELQYLYTVKTHDMETLLESYWAGVPEDLEQSPSIKEQVRLLGQDIRELERVMAERKAGNHTAPDSSSGQP